MKENIVNVEYLFHKNFIYLEALIFFDAFIFVTPQLILSYLRVTLIRKGYCLKSQEEKSKILMIWVKSLA